MAAIKARNPSTRVEVLVPDFLGHLASVRTVVAAPVDVFNHNVETVPRLYKRVRPGARYERSLTVLAAAYDSKRRVTKAGIMVGLGERRDEILAVLRDLRSVGCAVVTIGQYLRPSGGHIAVDRYVPPEEFNALRQEAIAMGFGHVESGPLVRSSYHAWSHVPEIVEKQ
jgi:lipoic acid synthetase